MWRNYLTLLTFLFTGTLLAQTKEHYSIQIKEQNLEQTIDQIEKLTGYHFYFNETWLKENSTLISLSLTDVELSEILKETFKDSNLNFFIQNKKIILTQNSIIYSKLPDNFFNTNKTNNNESATALGNPFFYKDANFNESDTQKTATIGRENKNSNQRTYLLSGKITESNGKPIADVVIKSIDNKYTTVTDSEGNFTLELPKGANTIVTESFLFQKATRNIVLYNDGKLDLKLSENVNQLKEVLVKGKKNDALKNSKLGVTSINVEAIKNIPMVLGERDILKAATIIPGVKTTGEGSSGFNVRGGKTDQNLIMLDKGVIYNPSHFFGFFSAINPYTVESADIYKGSIPAEYGGRLSSVFDIGSKKGNATKISGEGGIGPVTSNLTVSAPIVKDKASLLVGGRATYSDWILKSLDEESLKNSQASFYDMFLKYNHKISEKNTLNITGYYSKDKFSITSDSLYKYSNRLISVNWEHAFNPKHKTAVYFTNSNYKFNIDYQNEINPKTAFDFGYSIDDNQLQIISKYKGFNKHDITYGVSAKTYQINPGFLNPNSDASLVQQKQIEKEKGLEAAIFAGDVYSLTEQLQFNIGMRFSIFSALGSSTQNIYQEGVPKTNETVIETKIYGNNEVIKTYTGFEPRFAFRYLINDKLSVKAGYDKTYQYLHLLSNNTTQAPTDTWKLSDLNVKPQNADQFSVGIFRNFESNNIEVSLEGYYKRINNMLDYKVGAELLLNENIETELLKGKGKAYGVEFLIKKETGKLNGWVGYTYSRTFIQLDSPFDSEQVNNGEYFPANYDKPHDFNAILNYKLTHRYSFSANLVYQTGRPVTIPTGKYVYGNSEYTVYSDRNAYRIPDYYRLDLGINIEGNHKIKKLAHSFWNISVYNVLGRNNPYSVFFVTENGKIKAYKTSIFAVPVPTISYNFKF